MVVDLISLVPPENGACRGSSNHGCRGDNPIIDRNKIPAKFSYRLGLGPLKFPPAAADLSRWTDLITHTHRQYALDTSLEAPATQFVSARQEETKIRAFARGYRDVRRHG